MSALVPYITAWSTERPLPVTMTPEPADRHRLRGRGPRRPTRTVCSGPASRPGHGRPRFGSVHTLRQRRAMRRLLCQVCAGPADRTADGVLWLLKDHRADWPNWPNGMGATEPPICQRCAELAPRVCPALRNGHVVVRVGRSHLAGVFGIQYQPGPRFPASMTDVQIAFDDPAVRWVRAMQLIRELFDCTIVDL